MVTFFVFARLTDESNEEKIPFEKSLFDLVTFFKVVRLIDERSKEKDFLTK